MMLFLVVVMVPIFLLSLLAYRLGGIMAAAVVSIGLMSVVWTFMAYCVAYVLGYGHGDTREGNTTMIVLVGPLALWLGGKAYNNIMSLLWQRRQKRETPPEPQTYAERYPTRPPEPY